MSDITPVRKNIQVEETRFRFAVAESAQQKIGGSVNFINDFQYSDKQWFINGNYSLMPMPQTFVDGLTFFQYDAFIIDVWMFIEMAGNAGITELDLKRATTPGGSFTSIFTTTPKINAAAGDAIWIHVGSSIANTTAPVLSLTNVNAGDALRLDIIQTQTNTSTTGLPAGAGIVLHHRPR